MLSEYSDEDYFIFDCPGWKTSLDWFVDARSGADILGAGYVCAGQIELYSHLPVMKQLCDSLKDWGFNICCVYLVGVLVRTNACLNWIRDLTDV